jgi:exopolysaccharide biosynthesis polyprenyl glycosylphosphotransferase
LSTLPVESRTTRSIIAVRSSARAWMTRTPALVAWDVLTALLLFAATAPLAGIPLFDEHFRAAGVGYRGAPALVFAAAAPLLIALCGGYAVRQNPVGLGRTPRLAIASVLTCWMLWTVSALVGWWLDMVQLTVIAVGAPLVWLAGRQLAERARGRVPQRTLIAGSGDVARRVAELAERHPERGIQIVGRVDHGSEDSPWTEGFDPPILGSLDELQDIVRENGVHRVIVCFSSTPDEVVLDSVRRCDAMGVEVDVVPRLFELLGPSPQLDSLGGMGLVAVRPKNRGRIALAAKRALDIVVSAAALVIFSPVMLAVAIAIRVQDGEPVLFRQTRIGQWGRAFEIVKFRTMVQGAENAQAADLIEAGPDAIADIAETMKLESEAWITPVGHFLRRTSLDELPQLWNVLKGDMSLVGPRPLRRYEVEALTDWQYTRQEVRPGITGLWQILGRSEIHWDERMQLDYSYVRHWSFGNDLAILARTAGAVLSRRGAV